MQFWICRRQWPSDLGVGRLRWWDVSGWQEVPPPRAHWWGRGYPHVRWPKVCWNLPWVLHPGSHLGEINLMHLLLVVMLMRMTCWGLTPLTVGSPSSHGGKEFPKKWMGSQNISCTWGQAYNALSRGDWQLCPHFGPPSHTKGSGSPCWSGIVHLDHVCQSGPLSWGTLMGVPL